MMITMADARISPASARKPTGISKTPTEPKVRKRGYKRITVACTYCRHRKVRCEFTNDEDPYRRCDNCIKLDRAECRLRPVNDNEEQDDLFLDGECCGSASPSPSLLPDALVKSEDSKSPVQPPLAASPPFGTLQPPHAATTGAATTTAATSPRNEGLTRSNSAASTFSRRDTADSLAPTPVAARQPAAPQMILPSQKMQAAPQPWPAPAEYAADMGPYDASYLSNGFWNEPYAPAMPTDMGYYSSPHELHHPTGFPPLPIEAMSPAEFMWNMSPADLQPMGPHHHQHFPHGPVPTLSPADLHKQPGPIRTNSSGGRMQHDSTAPPPVVAPQPWLQAPATSMPLQSNFNPFDMAWDGFAAKH